MPRGAFGLEFLLLCHAEEDKKKLLLLDKDEMLIFHWQNSKCIKGSDVFFVLHSLQVNISSLPYTEYLFIVILKCFFFKLKFNCGRYMLEVNIVGQTSVKMLNFL